MAIKDVVAQMRRVEMDVDFGGGYALVAEHLLYGAQIGQRLFHLKVL